MEISTCRLPLNVLKPSWMRILSQCSRPGWRRRTALAFLTTFLCIAFLTVFHVETWRKHSSSHQGWSAISADGSISSGRRSYDSQETRNVRLSLDYTDPVLVDFPAPPVHKIGAYEKVQDAQEFSYGVVIDCGSSGSRVFAYYWPKHSGDPYELLKIQQLKTSEGEPVVMKITPGIAVYGNRPRTASTYLRPLLEYAAKHIPAEKHKETPLYILCTAGMRMLSKRMRNGILADLQTSIPKYSKFQFLPSHAEVISGMTEGLYFWMGLNYILGNLNQEQHVSNEVQSTEMPPTANATIIKTRPSTVGVIDMGGASLQIAFEITDGKPAVDLSKQTLKINLGCDEHKSEHEYSVFVETFLHKGGNAVRKVYEQDAFINFFDNKSEVLLDPCLPLGFEQELTHTLESKETVKFIMNGTGKYKECRKLLNSYLEKSSCEGSSPTCVLNGKTIPKINYENDHFFGSSEFFYCMDDVLRIGGAYNKLEYDSKAQEYCSTPWDITWKKYEDGMYRYADADRLRFQCFKSAWVSVVLHEGLNIPSDYQHLTSVKYINGSEIQWTLGAILYKTRFLPLREIQLQSLQAKNLEKLEKKHGFMDTIYYPFALMSHYPIMLILCIAIVIFCLLISVIRFCLHHNRKNVATLRRVGSSVAYFVHEGV